MKVIVTGAAGYLGTRVGALLASENSPIPVTELILVDITTPPTPPGRPSCSVRAISMDLTDPTAAVRLIDDTCHTLFHLAAVVSGHAEEDFDFGFRVNLDTTRALLEAARWKCPSLRMVFTSTVGVFGGSLPSVINEWTATTPQNSYGTAKAMSELLLNDYTRRGYVDGRAVRLPTVSVRAGTANRAVTSFASGIVREPLAGAETICPVDPDQRLWLTSPATVVYNIVYAATLPATAFEHWSVVNLPGFEVSVKDMVEALKTVAGEEVAARVRFQRDPVIAQMVASFPSRFDNTRALSLGFKVDLNFINVVEQYIREDLEQ